MSRLRRSRSRLLDKAAARLASVASLQLPEHQGGRECAELDMAIRKARESLQNYNALLSQADAAMQNFLDDEYRANDLSVRLLAQVKVCFGKRSTEYIQAGGKPPPLKRKRRKATAKP